MLDSMQMFIAGVILAAVVLVLLVLLIIQMVSASRFKKRVMKFLGSNSDSHNIEAMLLDYLELVNSIDRKYDSITSKLENHDLRLSNCISKVAMLRYNPFKEMGGDLCFALAMMDERSNGIVLNTIHGRDTSYTYCKPVSNKISSYNLSDEEKKVIEMAAKS
jgi:hypothetical protein